MARIETGHDLLNNVEIVKGKSVRFVTDNGETMFEVSWNDDGKSIDVRGCSESWHGNKMYMPLLDLRLNCANVVNVRARPSEE